MSLLLSDRSLLAIPQRHQRLTREDTCTVTVSQAPHTTYPDYIMYVNDSDVAYAMLIRNTFPEEEEGVTRGYLGWNKALYTTSFWVKLDLLSSFPVSRWEVRGIVKDTNVQPSRITVESSDNDSDWTTVADKTSLSEGTSAQLWVQAGLQRYNARFTRFTFFEATTGTVTLISRMSLWGIK